MAVAVAMAVTAVTAVTAAAAAVVVTVVVALDQESVDTNPARELLVVPRPLEVPGRGKQ